MKQKKILLDAYNSHHSYNVCSVSNDNPEKSALKGWGDSSVGTMQRWEPEVVAHTFFPSTQAETRPVSFEFEASLDYRAGSRTTRSKQRNPVWKKTTEVQSDKPPQEEQTPSCMVISHVTDTHQNKGKASNLS